VASQPPKPIDEKSAPSARGQASVGDEPLVKTIVSPVVETKPTTSTKSVDREPSQSESVTVLPKPAKVSPKVTEISSAPPVPLLAKTRERPAPADNATVNVAPKEVAAATDATALPKLNPLPNHQVPSVTTPDVLPRQTRVGVNATPSPVTPTAYTEVSAFLPAPIPPQSLLTQPPQPTTSTTQRATPIVNAASSPVAPAAPAMAPASNVVNPSANLPARAKPAPRPRRATLPTN
jgi:hypothetical protein